MAQRDRARARRDSDRAGHDRAVETLRRAVRDGDLDAVRRLLDRSVRMWVDAAGSAAATPGVVEGPDETARALCRVLRPGPGVDVSACSVNGTTGLVLRHEGAVVGILSLSVRSGRVAEVWAVLSPAKLQGWNRG